MRATIWCGASAMALMLGFGPAAVAQSSGGEGEVAEVVVTGSRIARADYTAESPIVSLTAEAVELAGPQTLEATFNQMPQFSATNANSSSSPARQGRNNANLRGLGIQRTLILLDGRRMQPSDALGAIDLNSISTSLVENVEVITGGASAVYGSDAIAGVVNFRLKRNFTGVELDAQYGVTERGDAEAVNLALSLGGPISDGRGHIMASMSYYDRGAVFRGTRSFFERSGVAGALQGGAIVSDATNLPTQAALNGVFQGIYGSATPPARNAPFAVNLDGTILTTQSPILNNRFPEGQPYIFDEGRLGFPQGATYPLQQPLERWTAFVRGRYELTESVEAYIQFNHMQYGAQYSRQGWSAGASEPRGLIPVTNPFVPQELRTIMASRPNPTAPMFFTYNTGRVGRTIYDFKYSIDEFLVGLTGRGPIRDWRWDVYASYGSTDASEVTSGFINVEAWQSLVNAPDGGASVCAGGFNPFLPESLSDTDPKCFDYLNRVLQERTQFEQQVVEGTMQGGLFDLPAGELRFAVGGTYRRSTYDYQPDEQRVRQTVWPNQPTGRAGGAYEVYELFGEVFVPLIRDQPFIRHLNADVAYRFSDYSSVGAVHTYKGSLDWGVIDSVRLRGSYQRAIRAPSLGELYAPPERASAGLGSTSVGGGDPCASNSRWRDPARNPDHARVRQLCLAQGVPDVVIDLLRFGGSSVSGVAAGNTNLREETADTYTAGVVWQSTFDSPWLRRLQVSLDYYNIQVEDAVGVITAQVGVQRCFNTDGSSNPNFDVNNFFCQLTDRRVDGGIETQRQPTLNLASYEVAGVDLQLDWRGELADLGVGDVGALSFNLIVSYLDKYKIQNTVDSPFLNFAGTIGNSQIDPGAIAFPEWKVSASLTWEYGPLSLTGRYRWFDSMTHSADVGSPTPSQPGVKTRSYADLVATWSYDEKTQFRAGVLNVFDTQPPVWTGNGSTDLGLYDLLQRRYYVGLKKSF
ncbi:TonB-dependent receptor [Phenylobacterium sp. SCN 70-31]|uniref:TonB-dependent receptor plug domain-containing protein n=1 Tax=Phenylobacterium sp. SCN 70-31 TaxID=1660129 RepID=UPI000A47AA4E|nr:TonB-dependent receptor [Phenylobacterium sp. SCN 70-31]